jgi:hypothetical protein
VHLLGVEPPTPHLVHPPATLRAFIEQCSPLLEFTCMN